MQDMTAAPVDGRLAAHRTPSRWDEVWRARGTTAPEVRDGTGGLSGSAETGRPGPAATAPRPLVCLVVDDQATTRSSLVGLLRTDARVTDVHTAPDALQALRLAYRTGVDLAFIEVGLPGIDGIELAWVLKRFVTPPPGVVFVARTSGRAADAFDVGAVDYLPKPISRHRLDESLRRALTRRYGPSTSVPIDVPISEAGARMPVPTATGLKLLRLNAIRGAQAKGDYVRLHTSEGEHLLRASITWLAQRLAPQGMIRIHRSFLVQPRLIQMIRSQGSGRLVVVIDGHQLPVSRRQLSALRPHLGLA